MGLLERKGFASIGNESDSKIKLHQIRVNFKKFNSVSFHKVENKLVSISSWEYLFVIINNY